MKTPAKARRKTDEASDEKSGPFDTITVKGSSVAIYRTPRISKGKTYDAFTLVWTSSGRRCRKLVADPDKARDVAKSIAGQLSAGTGHAHSLTPAEVADYVAARQAASPLGKTTLATIAADFVAAARLLPSGVTLRDAVAAYRKTHDRAATLQSATVESMVEKLKASREAAGASDRYLQDIRARLDTFAKAFRCQIASVTAPEVAAWLDKLGVGPRTRNNYRAAVVALFRFAKRQGCLPRNEVTEAELVDPAKPRASKVGIYTPAELRVLLNGLPKPMRPALAVAAFAGLRSAELYRLDWCEVDLKGGHITVAADKAKTAQRRLVPILPVLADWLAVVPEKKRKGRLIGREYSFPTSFDRAMRRETEAMNTRRQAAGENPVPRIPNALRHSFASYRLAEVKSADQVALEMGNSPRKLFTNYRELVTPEAAAEWFNIRPASTPANVVPIAKARRA